MIRLQALFNKSIYILKKVFGSAVFGVEMTTISVVFDINVICGFIAI